MITMKTATKDIKTISKEELRRKLKHGEPVQVVNVLEPHQYHLGSIKGSIKISLSRLERRLQELDPAKEVVTYGANDNCHASHEAAELLMEKGFTLRIYRGGIQEWKEAGLPTEETGRR